LLRYEYRDELWADAAGREERRGKLKIGKTGIWCSRSYWHPLKNRLTVSLNSSPAFLNYHPLAPIHAALFIALFNGLKSRGYRGTDLIAQKRDGFSYNDSMILMVFKVTPRNRPAFFCLICFFLSIFFPLFFIALAAAASQRRQTAIYTSALYIHLQRGPFVEIKL
jgi:hypothetical protein